ADEAQQVALVGSAHDAAPVVPVPARLRRGAGRLAQIAHRVWGCLLWVRRQAADHSLEHHVSRFTLRAASACPALPWSFHRWLWRRCALPVTEGRGDRGSGLPPPPIPTPASGYPRSPISA